MHNSPLHSFSTCNIPKYQVDFKGKANVYLGGEERKSSSSTQTVLSPQLFICPTINVFFSNVHTWVEKTW